MTAPPDPTISGDEDKCPYCRKPLSKHSYKEQKECTDRLGKRAEERDAFVCSLTSQSDDDSHHQIPFSPNENRKYDD